MWMALHNITNIDNRIFDSMYAENIYRQAYGATWSLCLCSKTRLQVDEH